MDRRKKRNIAVKGKGKGKVGAGVEKSEGRTHRRMAGETIENLPDVDPFSADLLGAIISILKLPTNIRNDYFNEIIDYLDESGFYSVIREAKGTEEVNRAVELRRKGASREDILKEIGVSSADFASKTGKNSRYIRAALNRDFLSKFIERPLKFLEFNLKTLANECDCSACDCYGPFLCPLVIVRNIGNNGYKLTREIRKRLVKGTITVE